MGESTSQIERDIAAERNELGRNLHVLESKARSMTDWRTHYRNYPFAMIGLALGAGALLGALTSGRGLREQEIAGFGEADIEYPTASRLAVSTARIRRQFGDTWDHIADALLAVASARAVQFVGDVVPGFREQLSVRHPEHRATFSSGTRST